MEGLILRAVSGFYYVKCCNEVFECKVRGNVRKCDINPLAGDIVYFTPDASSKGVIERVGERSNSFSRPSVANVDKLFIVSSYCTPAPSYYIIDTFIAICEHKSVEPVLVFNKCDLGDFDEWVQCYRDIGYSVVVTSALTGEGTEELRNHIKGNICVFTGNSGVGKSSLLNTIFNDLNLKTGDTSEKLGRGRHTTRHTELYETEFGGYVADSPGFSSIEAEKSDFSFKENLENCFVEFSRYSGRCKFTGCTHTGEKGCAICDAVSRGDISQNRFNSYLTLFNELKDLKKWQFNKK